jgi:hypothetical protein
MVFVLAITLGLQVAVCLVFIPSNLSNKIRYSVSPILANHARDFIAGAKFMTKFVEWVGIRPELSVHRGLTN